MESRELMNTMDAPQVVKPDLVVVPVDGKMRFIGVEAAAKYLGVASSTLRNIAAGRAGVMGYRDDTVERILGEYPQIRKAMSQSPFG